MKDGDTEVGGGRNNLRIHALRNVVESNDLVLVRFSRFGLDVEESGHVPANLANLVELIRSNSPSHNTESLLQGGMVVPIEHHEIRFLYDPQSFDGADRKSLHSPDARGSADFIGYDKQGITGRTVCGRNEGQTFGTDVSGFLGVESLGVVPVVDVLDETRIKRVAYVVDHDSALPFQTDESVDAPIHFSDSKPLGLDALVVTSTICVIVVDVEFVWISFLDDSLELQT